MTKELGILMMNTRFPRIPGDIGNPATFAYPIRRKYIEAATPDRVSIKTDHTLLDNFIEGAKELERAGVSAITTSCGFLTLFQEELANSVSVPVFTSSLMLGRVITPMLKKDQRLGIITINERNLTQKHMESAGIAEIGAVVQGVSDTEFGWLFTDRGEGIAFNYPHLEGIMVDAALRMKNEHPEVGAILLECTNMPPFAKAMRMASGLPVFSAVTLANLVMGACD